MAGGLAERGGAAPPTSRNASSRLSGSTSGVTSRNDLHHPGRHLGVVGVVAGQEGGVRAQPPGPHRGHRRVHAVGAGLVAGRRHHAPRRRGRRRSPACPAAPGAAAAPPTRRTRPCRRGGWRGGPTRRRAPARSGSPGKLAPVTGELPASSLPPSARRVLEAAADLGLDIEVRAFPEGTRTADDAARAIGLRRGPDREVPGLPHRRRGGARLRVGRQPPRRGEAGRRSPARAPTRWAGPTPTPCGPPPPTPSVACRRSGTRRRCATWVDLDLLDHDVVWAAAGTPTTSSGRPALEPGRRHRRRARRPRGVDRRLVAARADAPADPPTGPESALPPVKARVIAFVAILVGGLCGGIIGQALVNIQCTGDCSEPAAIGALMGAITGAAGVAVVAVLALRAMGEWRTIEHGRSVDRELEMRAEDGRSPRLDYDPAARRRQLEAAKRAAELAAGARRRSTRRGLTTRCPPTPPSSQALLDSPPPPPTPRRAARRRPGAARATTATKSTSTDMVSEMDRAAEALIRDRLLGARPSRRVPGRGVGRRTHGTSGLRWVVDPLDGTTNYLYDHAGLERLHRRRGRATARSSAWWSTRSCGDTFTAAARRGATRNGTPIRLPARRPTSRPPCARTGFGYDPDRRRRQAAVLDQGAAPVRDIRRVGAAAVDLCSVACGRVDAYWERGLGPVGHGRRRPDRPRGGRDRRRRRRHRTRDRGTARRSSMHFRALLVDAGADRPHDRHLIETCL